MPLLTALHERFGRDRPFEGLSVAACLHITAETANLVRLLRAGGAAVSLAASNPLSTQDDIAAALAINHGIAVFARAGVDRKGYYRHIEAALANAAPDLVMDDGGDLVNTLHTRAAALLPGVKGGCESTATGVIRLRRMAAEGALAFPVIAANDTAVKRMVDNTCAASAPRSSSPRSTRCEPWTPRCAGSGCCRWPGPRRSARCSSPSPARSTSSTRTTWR
jgi:adenosylhomocysteinase